MLSYTLFRILKIMRERKRHCRGDTFAKGRQKRPCVYDGARARSRTNTHRSVHCVSASAAQTETETTRDPCLFSSQTNYILICPTNLTNNVHFTSAKVFSHSWLFFHRSLSLSLSSSAEDIRVQNEITQINRR